MGSPPPMRGKEKYLAGDDRNLGITPAYAGKRPQRFSECYKVVGSPPPMRGKGFFGLRRTGKL